MNNHVHPIFRNILNSVVMTRYEPRTPRYGIGDTVYLLDNEIYDKPTWIEGEVTGVTDEIIVIKWQDLPEETEYNLSDLPNIQTRKPEEPIFTIEDLVSFGNYLLSEQRKQSYLSNPAYPNGEMLEERLKGVHHADVENWKAING